MHYIFFTLSVKFGLESVLLNEKTHLSQLYLINRKNAQSILSSFMAAKIAIIRSYCGFGQC